VGVLSCVGNIARDYRDEPRLHAPVVLGKSDGTSHGGHLLAPQVTNPGVVIIESARHLCRTMRPEFGLASRDFAR
jgi:predicted DNA-binding protein with PD1-like motif